MQRIARQDDEAGADAFQFPQRDDVKVAPDRVQHDRMTPAMREGLDALEREFSDLMSRGRENQSFREIEQRIDVARRLLDISGAR